MKVVHALLEQLLKTGANPNGIKDKNGLYPLHFAALLGQEQSVATLLHHGADPFKTDNQGRFPLQLAIEEGWPRIIDHLSGAMSQPGEIKGKGEESQYQYLRNRALDLIRTWRRWRKRWRKKKNL